MTVRRLFVLLMLACVLLLVAGCKDLSPIPVLVATPAQGEAPLQVTFDTSGSLDPNGEIAGCSLAFGDGKSSACDQSVTILHTYVNPGTYYAELQIMDNSGNLHSDQVLIEVSQPSLTNLPPTAHLAATPSTGQAPLSVEFDMRTSLDQDGYISAFELRFGDGESQNGVDVTETIHHTYSTHGTYTALLIVTDNKDTSDAASIQISVTGGAISDTTPPEFSHETPSANSTSGAGPITINISDDSSGVDSTSIVMNIEDIAYSVDDSGVSWDGTSCSVEEDVFADRFSSGDDVTVIVSVSDIEGNSSEFSWTFTWAEDAAPIPGPPPPPG